MVYFNRPGLPTGVRNLLIVTLAVFVLQVLPLTEQWTVRWGALVPFAVFRRGEVWRLVTYMFLHGGPFHLFFNLLALWMFGVEIEQLWGTRRFVVFYLVGGVCSGLLSVFMAPGVFVIGASGAVLAVLTVYAFYFPRRQVLMFLIFPVPVWLAVGIIGFISIVSARSNVGGIAHLVHLGGILVGVAYVKGYPLLTRLRERSRRLRAERHMRRNAEQRLSRDRYYEEQIDPILRKISREGIGALTKKEKDVLREASKRGQGAAGRIIPFDFTK